MFFKQARPEGFRTAFISNGNATPQVLDYLRPWTDCYKIDLKSMSDRNYRQLGGVVDNILDTVQDGPRPRLLGRDRDAGDSRLQ